MAASRHLALRKRILRVARRLNESGLNQGTSGNVSARVSGGILITPSGLAYETMTADDLVFMDFSGQDQGNRKPSSEWRFHLAVLQARPEAGGVVHVHSPFATVLACLRQGIPAFHYMVAAAGGADIRCADYATFGTQALADNVLAALKNRKACLLANHGMVALGGDVESALALAVEVEALAAQYIRARQIGEPTLLGDDEMARMLTLFEDYGAAADRK